MGHCVNHPERETRYECSKHQVYMCKDCLDCRDPDIYCKFRESCTIWFLTQKNFDDFVAGLQDLDGRRHGVKR